MAEVTVSTAVPSVTFSATGIAVPDEIDILNGRLTDLDTAMGGGMSKSLTTRRTDCHERYGNYRRQE
jgi:hypothetical protein